MVIVHAVIVVKIIIIIALGHIIIPIIMLACCRYASSPLANIYTTQVYDIRTNCIRTPPPSVVRDLLRSFHCNVVVGRITWCHITGVSKLQLALYLQKQKSTYWFCEIFVIQRHFGKIWTNSQNKPMSVV